jgi:glycosyltransferase involved in cell wall biosynthesis
VLVVPAGEPGSGINLPGGLGTPDVRTTGGPLRIGMDVTPLLGALTGVGRYVEGLLQALAQSPDGEGEVLRGTAFTVRRRDAMRERLPEGVRVSGPPVPARALQLLWTRTELLPVTVLSGRTDVFHGTNFVLPPTGRAAGVVTVHDLSYLRTPHTVSSASLAYRELVPRSIRRAAVVCTPSRAIADEVAEEYGVPEDRLVVTPLGVSPDWARAEPPDDDLRRRLGLPSDYYVFSGSLEPRKNLSLLVEAQRRLKAEDRNAPALVLTGPAGWGPRLDLTGLTADDVLLTGYLDEADLRRTVAGARLLAYPSAYEGFGLPPLEAFACGVPVVASDLAVVREVVGTETGLARLVPPGDLEGLVDALRAQLSDPEPAGLAAARRRRAAEFDWAATASRTREAYRRAVTGP